jgi:hypothetical protein
METPRGNGMVAVLASPLEETSMFWAGEQGAESPIEAIVGNRFLEAQRTNLGRSLRQASPSEDLVGYESRGVLAVGGTWGLG